MKKLNCSVPLFLIFLIGLSLEGFPQLPDSSSTHWEMDIVVKHPSGSKDTITIGTDINGSKGFQPGLDIMDTSFRTPVSIGVNDPVIQKDSMTCPANMRRDIREFRDTLYFTFFLKSDTFPWVKNSSGFIKDSMIQLFFDSSQFSYKNETWEIGWIQISSEGGYFDDVDGVDRCLYSNIGENFYCNYPWEPKYENPFSFLLLHEENPNEYYFGVCAENYPIIKFTVEILFQDKSIGIKEERAQSLVLNNNGYLEIKNTRTGNYPYRYSIFNLSGRKVFSGELLPGELKRVDNTTLPVGLYIININSGNFLKTYKFFIN